VSCVLSCVLCPVSCFLVLVLVLCSCLVVSSCFYYLAPRRVSSVLFPLFMLLLSCSLFFLFYFSFYAFLVLLLLSCSPCPASSILPFLSCFLSGSLLFLSYFVFMLSLMSCVPLVIFYFSFLCDFEFASMFLCSLFSVSISCILYLYSRTKNKLSCLLTTYTNLLPPCLMFPSSSLFFYSLFCPFCFLHFAISPFLCNTRRQEQARQLKDNRRQNVT
jgi:hypothetical protein